MGIKIEVRKDKTHERRRRRKSRLDGQLELQVLITLKDD